MCVHAYVCRYVSVCLHPGRYAYCTGYGKEIVNNMTELSGRSTHRHVMLTTDELKLKYGNICQEGAHATRNARIQGRRQERETKAALKARHKRRKDQKAKYARRDAKDDDDRSGRKLWLEYKRRSAKANNKRKREDTQRINLEAPKTDLQAFTPS